MNNMFNNMVYVLFPILIYFVLIAYNKSVNDRDSKIILDISLVFCVLLIIDFGKPILNYDIYYLFNIPLLISYIKKRNGVIITISIIIIYYLSSKYNIYLLLINYLLLFFIYKFYKNNIIYFIINSIFILLYHNLNIDYLFSIFIYLIANYLVIYLFNYIDKVMKFYMTLKDIVNNKELQNSLFKISHEVKNPLAVCKGYLELMDGSTDKYDKYYPIINNEINHSLQILKDFSSIGKLKIELDIMDMVLLLDEVINDYKIILDNKNILLIYDNKYDEVLINGDYVRLKEVIINAIKNSIEALDGITNSIIKIVVKKTNKKIYLKIIDNGCGSEDISRIAEPFFTTKKNGTGLGTYLSREIIDGHNGSIKYQSKPNIGMEVKIVLDSYNI